MRYALFLTYFVFFTLLITHAFIGILTISCEKMNYKQRDIKNPFMSKGIFSALIFKN